MFVLVELGATQKSPSRSPTKIYTPLQVAEPGQCSRSTPDILQQTRAVEDSDGIERVSLTNLTEYPSFVPLLVLDSTDEEENIPTEEVVLSDQETPEMSAANSPLPQTPPIVIEKREPTTNTTTSPRFTEFLRNPRGTVAPTGGRKIVGVDVPLSSDVEEAEPKVDGTKESAEHAENNDLEADLSTDSLSGLGGETDGEMVQRVTITRREAIALTNVLDKIPRTVMQQDNQATVDNITLTVVDKPSNPPEPNVQDDEQGGSAEFPSGDSRPNPSPDDRPVLRGKRRRPKYSLTTAMLKKHPVVQYFATGPLDRSKNPYKWWCRVCRIELSLMSRGVLELLSHFRTETHLLKEHRIRLETPGLPLFDQNENELHGVGLQEAKRRARESHPIAPQLDSCRLLVGQDRLPEFSSTTNPSESVLAQICILEHGLRHGGHVDLLLGIWEDMTRLTPGSSAQTTSHNWTKHRLYVSIIAL